MIITYVQEIAWPILYIMLLYKMGQDFLDLQYIDKEVNFWKTVIAAK